MTSAAGQSRQRTDNFECADRLVALGTPVSAACGMAGVSKASYYRWRAYGIRHAFFYGSLRRGEEGYTELLLDRYLKYIGEDAIPGSLYDLGSYPGLRPIKPGAGSIIKGELYLIKEHRILKIIDEFEGYAPGRKSAYVRKTVTTTGHGQRAWVYFYVGSVKKKRLIEAGDWISYKCEIQPVIS